MSDNIVFTNNASALLAATITASDTTIQVATGYGALFPNPGASEFFYMSLEDNSGNIEIVRVTDRTDDSMTVVRAQDGTTAQAFTLTTTRCELRVTKIVLEEFLQKNGGTMTGAIDMNGNNITDAVLNGASTQMLAGEIVGVPLRGATGVSSNEIAVPAGGGRATAGGVALLAVGDDIVAELDTAGVITLDSATIGVVMDQSNAYFRMQGAHRIAAPGVPGDYLEQTHDGTDFTFNFVNTDEVNWNAVLNMADSILKRVRFQDFSMDKQNVTASASTTIDYEAGSYVTLTMNTSITTLTLSNPPASTGVGVLRLKVVQDATGSRTITWPASVKWPNNGVAPTLSTGNGEIDFIDLWTDDGGTTWYGAYNIDWA